MSVKVLIADDQDLVRTGFEMILDAEPDIDVVGNAANGQEAVALTRELRPDVVLMDIRMPLVDGIEATRQLVNQHNDPPVRVLILTTFDLDEYVLDALRAGASGFLLKDVRASELVLAVRTISNWRCTPGSRDYAATWSNSWTASPLCPSRARWTISRRENSKCSSVL